VCTRLSLLSKAFSVGLARQCYVGLISAAVSEGCAPWACIVATDVYSGSCGHMWKKWRRAAVAKRLLSTLIALPEKPCERKLERSVVNYQTMAVCIAHQWWQVFETEWAGSRVRRIDISARCPSAGPVSPNELYICRALIQRETEQQALWARKLVLVSFETRNYTRPNLCSCPECEAYAPSLDAKADCRKWPGLS